MSRILRIYLLAFVAAFLGSAAQAQSFAEYPEAQIEPYFVGGATSVEIFASITRNAREAIPNGGPAHAYAQSQFRWTTRANGGACDVDLTMELMVVFPRHVDPDGLTGDAWTWWSGYIQALERHEAGHLQIASDTYPALLEALESGPCETALARGSVILDDLGERQTRYDAITNHGAAQDRAFN